MAKTFGQRNNYIINCAAFWRFAHRASVYLVCTLNATWKNVSFSAKWANLSVLLLLFCLPRSVLDNYRPDVRETVKGATGWTCWGSEQRLGRMKGASIVSYANFARWFIRCASDRNWENYCLLKVVRDPLSSRGNEYSRTCIKGLTRRLKISRDFPTVSLKLNLVAFKQRKISHNFYAQNKKHHLIDPLICEQKLLYYVFCFFRYFDNLLFPFHTTTPIPVKSPSIGFNCLLFCKKHEAN